MLGTRAAAGADDVAAGVQQGRVVLGHGLGPELVGRLPPSVIGSPAFGYAMSGASVTARISRMMTIARSGPRPQFMPTMSAPAPSRLFATSAGLSPHMVRSRSCISSYWKNIVAITGRSATALHARIAAMASWGNIMVSTAKMSTPPSASASACSLKGRDVLLVARVPEGLVLDRQPARRADRARDVAGRAGRPSAPAARPCRFSSRVRSPIWYSFSLSRVPPKVLVSTKSEPASK